MLGTSCRPEMSFCEAEGRRVQVWGATVSSSVPRRTTTGWVAFLLQRMMEGRL